MANLRCDSCGGSTDHYGSWDTPFKILCDKCTSNVLICNNCKDIWIAPKNVCDCGCSVLSKTASSNASFAKNK